MGGMVISLGADEHEYKIGDVTYVVASHFAPQKDQDNRTISDYIKSYIGGDFSDLTSDLYEDTMDAEYGCSVAGKEDKCSRKTKN